MTDKIHLFELAGLGIAPFRVIGIQTASDRRWVQKERENNGQTFTTNYCTTCDYCGTAIQNAFQVLSADQKQFKVGCDCLAKVGEKGLVDHAKLILKEKKAKEEHERWVAAYKQREADERAANGGKTLREIEIERAEQLHREQVAEVERINAWILEKVTENDWRGVRELSRVPIQQMSGRFIAVVRNIWCKKFGRANSKAYKAAEVEFDSRLNG